MEIKDTMENITIYGIFDPTNSSLKYIGRTGLKLNRRLSNHVYKAKSGRSKSNLSKWILSLVKAGLIPKIEEICTYQCMFNLEERKLEKDWILHFLHDGYELLNHTFGGNGNHSGTSINKEILEILGKMPDAKIAKIAGVSRKCISYYREKLNIPPAPKESYTYNPHTKGKPSPKRIKFTQEIKDLIGTMSDTEVAKLAKVHRRTIGGFRKRNGIKAYVPSGENHPRAKLIEQDVDNILTMYRNGETINSIVKKVKVPYYIVWDILNGKSWKEYTGL